LDRSSQTNVLSNSFTQTNRASEAEKESQTSNLTVNSPVQTLNFSDSHQESQTSPPKNISSQTDVLSSSFTQTDRASEADKHSQTPNLNVNSPVQTLRFSD